MKVNMEHLKLTVGVPAFHRCHVTSPLSVVTSGFAPQVNVGFLRLSCANRCCRLFLEAAVVAMLMLTGHVSSQHSLLWHISVLFVFVFVWNEVKSCAACVAPQQEGEVSQALVSHSSAKTNPNPNDRFTIYRRNVRSRSGLNKPFTSVFPC